MTPGNWDKANAANDLVSMVYMRKDGTGLMHTTESGEVEAITMDDLHPYAVEVMESALQGKKYHFQDFQKSGTG